MIIFFFPTTEFQSVTFAKQILLNHIEIDGSCCNTPSPAHDFATVTNVTKRQTSGQIIRYSRRKIQPDFQSRLAGDKWLHLTRMLK
jgi:hypothetical protein